MIKNKKDMRKLKQMWEIHLPQTKPSPPQNDEHFSLNGFHLHMVT